MTATATLGVDLGGTGTRVVALDADGVTVASKVFRTLSAQPVEAVHALTDALADTAGNLNIRAVGIGASGPVDAGGVIRNTATLRAYTGLDLRGIVREHLGWRCVIDNDAAAAAMGEFVYGAGLGSSSTVTVTLGTGIGVAVILDGALVRAADGTHPEAGHIAVRDAPIRCYCGLGRCWEQAASRTALEGLIGGNPTIAADAARHGNTQLAGAFERYGERVASGLGTLLTLYRPGRVILGGSAAQYFDLFSNSLASALRRAPDYNWSPPIVQAQLGDLSGAVGAAVLAR